MRLAYIFLYRANSAAASSSFSPPPDEEVDRFFAVLEVGSLEVVDDGAWDIICAARRLRGGRCCSALSTLALSSMDEPVVVVMFVVCGAGGPEPRRSFPRDFKIEGAGVRRIVKHRADVDAAALTRRATRTPSRKLRRVLPRRDVFGVARTPNPTRARCAAPLPGGCTTGGTTWRIWRESPIRGKFQILFRGAPSKPVDSEMMTGYTYI